MISLIIIISAMRHRPPDGMLTFMEGNPLYPVSLTLKYLQFLGEHRGSLQPTCMPGNTNLPHPTKVVIYSNALKVRIITLILFHVCSKPYVI